MNTNVTVIAVVMAVLISGAVATVPSSTAANAEDSHEISECTTIDEPGTYRLTNDIAADGDRDECLSVEAHGVTIDGNGYSITNASGPQAAIYSSYDDVVVKNLTVSGFSTAIDLEMGAEVTLDGVTLRNNGVGIVGTQVSPTLNNSVLEGNDVAISLGESKVESANTVYQNNSEGVIAGYIVSVNDTYVGNGDFAIEAPGGSVSGATIEDTAGSGIVFVENYVSPDDENQLTVVDSVIRENDGHGIYVPEDNYGGQNLTVENSVIADNSGLGVNVGDGNPIADATGNYWGAGDGPSSATDEHAPFEDPVTGKLAMGIGDEVSENPDQQGVSNVHFDPFLTENPNADDGTDGDQNDSSPHEISECTAITEPGTYEIVSDITNESANECIEVRTSDVTIDGNGHTVDGVDQNGTGIQAELGDNVTADNVTVTGFEAGLQAASLAEVTVVDSRFDGNEYGMSVEADATLTVEDSEVVNSESTGISAIQSTLTVVDSELVGNGASGVATGLTDATLRNNLFAENRVGLDADEGDTISENNTFRDNSEAGIVAMSLVSTNDVVEDNGVGIRGEDNITLTGTVVRDNDEHGVELLPGDPEPVFANIADSTIVDNGGDGIHVDADNRDLAEPVSEFTAEIHGTTIADNDGLGVNNTEPTVVNATGNDWGAEDGPGSADDPDAPFEDPVTGALADGDGDEVSEHPEKPGVSNVHFDEQRAFQFDVATGEVIEDIGEDEDAFYGRQGRLVQAKTVMANGTLTGSYNVPQGMATTSVDGCPIRYDAVSYDQETGAVSVTVSLSEDADCDAVVVTLAAYELPSDDTEFVRAHADGQELVVYETVTLDAGEKRTVTIDVDE